VTGLTSTGRAASPSATNGLLRQYFPKGTDLARCNATELDAVAEALNSRPERLGWRAPAEALNDHILSLHTGSGATTG
jgi:IS30 family transposase